MSASNARREEDVAKLRALEAGTHGQIRVTKVAGNPISQIDLRFTVRTASDNQFPQRSIDCVDALVSLGSRYPFEEPSVSVATKVFNPNIYTSGRVCLGSKWLPTECLDLLAQRLFKILAFDEGIINVASAANGEAARWYLRAKEANPSAFPSDTLQTAVHVAKPSITWSDKSPAQSFVEPEKVIIACTHCGAKLRVVAGRVGTVNCPTCKKSFVAKS